MQCMFFSDSVPFLGIPLGPLAKIGHWPEIAKIFLVELFLWKCTLPETNSSPMKIPIFPGFHTIKMGDFPWAMLVYREGRLCNVHFVGSWWQGHANLGIYLKDSGPPGSITNMQQLYNH